MLAAVAGARAKRIGRYALFGEIAAGGTATVHIGRLLGPVGFARTVAIKQLHPHFAKAPDFAAMLLDEARLAARLHHPNVVPILDVVAHHEDGGDALLLVMDFVHGVSLSELLKLQRQRALSTPIEIAAAIMVGVLHGLHAAHEAKSEQGAPLQIVHRDVSPQNILIGADGVPRLVDFGIAKATTRAQVTREGEVKGKFAYMAPEQLGAAYGVRGTVVTHRVDLYAAGLVTWEVLVGRRALDADDEGALLDQVRAPQIQAPSSSAPFAAPLDNVVMHALEIDPNARFASAREMALAIEAAVPIASASQIGAWVESLASAQLKWMRGRIDEVERAGDGDEDFRSSIAPTSGQPTARVRPPGELATPQTHVAEGLASSTIARVDRDDTASTKRRSWRAIGGVAAALAIVT
ncbi:MAG: serine/threonine-protein kinase, partial [Polyangiales bacterium]